MKFDVNIAPHSLNDVPELARKAEDIGADGLWVGETQHHPFLPLTLVAAHSSSLEFGTNVAIAFGRSPLALAHTGWDLSEQSGGRFLLGLGTQVKPHVERRFGMGWPDSPAGKLRELVAAVRAIWRTWQTGEKLNFRGEYFKHTLMTPFFSPPPIARPDIPIYLAGVNPVLTRLAGETADGFHAHPLHSARSLRELTLPNIAAGAARAGRTRSAVTVIAPAFVAIGDDEETRRPMRESAREQISFYASTPTYRSILALYDRTDIAEQLSHHAARKQWSKMPALIPDDLLAEFVTEGTWDDIGARLCERYAGLLDRVAIYVPLTAESNVDDWKKLARGVRQ